MKRMFAGAMVFAAFSLVTGCATTQTQKTTGTTQGKKVAAPKTTPKRVSKSGTGNTITVMKGQTRWGIAKSDEGYGKSCNWPVIYKANTGEVQDPDLIYPGQVLTVPQSVSADESDRACQAAKEYGPYQPHSKPRADVKLDY
jgi:LysM repeat protein